MKLAFCLVSQISLLNWRKHWGKKRMLFIALHTHHVWRKERNCYSQGGWDRPGRGSGGRCEEAKAEPWRTSTSKAAVCRACFSEPQDLQKGPWGFWKSRQGKESTSPRTTTNLYLKQQLWLRFLYWAWMYIKFHLLKKKSCYKKKFENQWLIEWAERRAAHKGEWEGSAKKQ